MTEVNRAPAPGSGIAGETTLKRNTLTLPEVLAQSVANAAPSAAMALLPLLVFLNAGNGSWVAFVIAVVLMVCVGYCASQFAKRMNSAGSRPPSASALRTIRPGSLIVFAKPRRRWP